MQINRLFEIVYILLNKKVTTAKELCEHFEVSQRTIYRDIETLCQAGIPIYTSKGKGGGIGLLDQFVESHRTVAPRKLLFRGQAWYLLGFCEEKKENRYFKISRIKSLSICEETFELPAFEKQDEIAPNHEPNQMINLKLKIDSEMAFRIFDEFPKEAIVRNTDGSFLINAKLQTGGWLIGYLMSYEDHLEIIEPTELREKLLDKYKNILKKYKYDM